MRDTVLSVLGCVLVWAGLNATAAGQATRLQTPWWKRGRINFMWGGWSLCSKVPSDKPIWARYERPVPRETFRDVGQAGGTVFADTWRYSAEHARLAKEFGLRYFACVHLGHMESGGRRWINRAGVEVEKSKDHLHTCPLDESEYERWLAAPPVQEGIRDGIVDGIHVDWEATEGGLCYCDHCFAGFLERNGIAAELPEKPERSSFIEKLELEAHYEADFHRQRFEMFARIRKKLQRLNPRLLFSSYGTTLSDFTRAMHTPETPFIFLDARHYYNDDRQPWWESYSQRIKAEGYLYIPGGWTNALFGAQPSQVSAARWIYEAMVNEDGVWIWWEHRLTDEVYTAYATAQRQVQEVQDMAGEFLINGRRDLTFATVVEWTGNPELEKAAVQRTYHVDGRHLVHVNNVNADWPLRVRLRFPVLAEGRWTVRNPRGGACYSVDGKTALWSTDQLLTGVVVTLDARSDLFLLLAPAANDPAEDGAALLRSREFDTFYDHESATRHADPVKTVAVGKDFAVYDSDLERLLDTSTELLQLPRDGWRFRMDPENVGATERWFAPETPTDEGWVPIDTETAWGDKGGVGFGWYRRRVQITALPEERRFYLHFGAVDEDLRLWIDGAYVGEYSRGPAGWDQPFAMDVTRKLTEGEHELALRVHNRAYAGGVWKPVRLIAAPARGQGASGQTGPLLCTVAQQMINMVGEWGSAFRCFVNNAIWVVPGVGQHGQKLRHLYGQLWAPSYSPDGSRIAFTHDAGGRGQVFVMNSDGSGAANLSDNNFCDRTPVWSPDGSRIAFVSDQSGDWDIYVTDADGSGRKRLAGNPGLDRAPAWSPDGRRLAWESHVTGIPGVWIAGADGTDPRPAVDPNRPFTVRRAERGQDGVFAFPEAGWPFPDNTVYLTDPVWAPDGRRLAARGVGAYSGVMAAVLNVEDNSMLQVIGWIGGLDNLAWSPNGTRLAASFRTAPQETDRSGILVVKADGTDEKPGGDFIVDVTPRGPRLTRAVRQGVPTWYAHGSARPRRVLKTFTSLHWSPDGETLAFSADLDPTGAFHVYTIPAAGGSPVRLDATESAWPNQIDWEPR